MSTPRLVGLVTDDLMFESQLQSLVTGLGHDFAVSRDDLIPAEAEFVFVDLNRHAASRIDAIARLRAAASDRTIIGFCHHLEKDLRRTAMERGASMVITNGSLVAAAHRLLAGEPADTVAADADAEEAKAGRGSS